LSSSALPVRPPIFPSADVAFKVLLSARICASIWSHISDCDETFNYWEPLHYLLYNKGLQTWEYSPEFALRSYTYLMIHGAPAYIYKQIFDPNPMLVFYFIRLLLGLGCAFSEVYFYKYVLILLLLPPLIVIIFLQRCLSRVWRSHWSIVACVSNL
jgi:alpha-1,2-mannosyltransferase